MKNSMTFAGLVGAFAVCCMAVLSAPPANAGDSGWMPLSKVKSHLSALKASGQLPVSIDCRNDSKVKSTWKPFVRIQSKPNASGTKWYVISKVEFRDFQPGSPLDKNRPKWRVVSRKIVQGGGGGTKLFCTIWHG